jgi:hypothetical protein
MKPSPINHQPKGKTKMNTATEKQYSSREEIFNDPQMGTYDKSLALAEWDKTHPPEPSARDEILSRGLPAFQTGQLIAELPPEQPARPRLLPGEREACAEAAINLKSLKASYTELVSGLEKYRSAHEQTVTELRKLEKNLMPDDEPGIRSLIYMEARQRVIVRYLDAAPDKIRAVENSVNNIIRGVDLLFSKRFGMTKEPGGREWANVGFGALPTRITGAVAAIETELNRK